MSVQAVSDVPVSYEDYLAMEATSDVKHEWLDGLIYAMSRGTPEHARLSANVTSALRSAFKGICSIYSSDAMLFISESHLLTYADASVVCGSVETHRVMKNGRALGEAITNPAVVVEVLSEGTEDYDRGEKFGHYMRLVSLREYVLVSQNEERIEVSRRPEGGGHWVHEVRTAGETFSVFGRELRVDEVYEK